MKLILNPVSGHRLVFHVLFCLGVLSILSLWVYFLYLGRFPFAPLQTFADCLFFLACIYTGRWLFQTWYLREKAALFVVAGLLALALAGVSVVEWSLARYVFGHPHAGFLEVFRGQMPFLWSGVALGILLALVSASMKKELKDAQTKAEQKESELSLLQSQLSPHFLFNVLNNLYGISIDQPGRMPALLLKLSQLLRYSLYGSRQVFVPLADELAYIGNYIEFEKIRTSDRLNLNVDLPDRCPPRVRIAPQVLIVFVENAFTHSKNALSPRIDIDISLKILEDHICLHISNTYGAEEDPVSDKGAGLGLANTRRRLDLLYGSDYAFHRQVDEDRYHIELRLKIK